MIWHARIRPPDQPCLHVRRRRSGGLVELRLDASLSGEYAPLMHFINGLERSKTFFLINGLTLTGQQGGLVNLRLKLNTYLHAADLEQLPPPVQGDEGAAGGGSPLMALKVGTEDKKKVYLAAAWAWSCSSCWCDSCGRPSAPRPLHRRRRRR